MGQAAYWQYPEAQKALCDYAKDRERKPPDRFLAIGQLARLIPMELTCSHRAELVFESLIDLLMDPDAKVRGAAFAALMGKGAPGAKRAGGGPAAQPPSPNGFGYSPRAKEPSREKAVERWRRWLKD